MNQDKQIYPCPKCNGTMALMQDIDGAFFVCGECGCKIHIVSRDDEASCYHELRSV